MVNVHDMTTDSNLESKEHHTRKYAQVDFFLNKEANNLTELVVRETFQKWGGVYPFQFYLQRTKQGRA